MNQLEDKPESIERAYEPTEAEDMQTIEQMIDEALVGIREEDQQILKQTFIQRFLHYAGYARQVRLEVEGTSAQPKRELQKAVRPAQGFGPMMEAKIRFQYSRMFSDEEFNRLQYGLIPQSQEERWFVFMESNGLYFYRAHSQECVYQIQLIRQDEGYGVAEAWLDTRFIQSEWVELEYALQLLDYIISRMLLGRRVRFPYPHPINNPMERAMFRHTMVGCGRANDEQ